MMSTLRDPKYPIIIASIVAIIFVSQYFYPAPSLTTVTSQLGNWAIVLAAYAMCYGLLSQTIRNIGLITKSGGKDLYSIVVTVFALVTFALGSFSLKQPTYEWIFNNIYTSLGSTFVSFSFLYTASAVVRVLKFKGILPGLFTAMAIANLLGDMTILRPSTMLFYQLKMWLADNVVTGPYTAFRISLGIGMVLMGIRVVLGSERGWLGRQEEGER